MVGADASCAMLCITHAYYIMANNIADTIVALCLLQMLLFLYPDSHHLQGGKKFGKKNHYLNMLNFLNIIGNINFKVQCSMVKQVDRVGVKTVFVIVTAIKNVNIDSIFILGNLRNKYLMFVKL